MSSDTAIVRPSLIVVTGRPGAGKSTLAHALARAVRCPLLSRDEIKEGLVHTTGELGEPGAKRSGAPPMPSSMRWPCCSTAG